MLISSSHEQYDSALQNMQPFIQLGGYKTQTRPDQTLNPSLFFFNPKPESLTRYGLIPWHALVWSGLCFMHAQFSCMKGCRFCSTESYCSWELEINIKWYYLSANIPMIYFECEPAIAVSIGLRCRLIDITLPWIPIQDNPKQESLTRYGLLPWHVLVWSVFYTRPWKFAYRTPFWACEHV